jgi:hypothetical protein
LGFLLLHERLPPLPFCLGSGPRQPDPRLLHSVVQAEQHIACPDQVALGDNDLAHYPIPLRPERREAMGPCRAADHLIVRSGWGGYQKTREGKQVASGKGRHGRAHQIARRR